MSESGNPAGELINGPELSGQMWPLDRLRSKVNLLRITLTLPTPTPSPLDCCFNSLLSCFFSLTFTLTPLHGLGKLQLPINALQSELYRVFGPLCSVRRALKNAQETIVYQYIIVKHLNITDYFLNKHREEVNSSQLLVGIKYTRCDRYNIIIIAMGQETYYY